ncbi:hypothetical protein C4D60_Mb06t03200 [Musa balbisiana]|uniref:CCT domain-containing protein n=1 Tax=Musa balbisiana TaxID=52838 RepID=A0A4S8IK85_MUSBA|nr:hypothetical protein C4D60_Mb06t03200 [Musa balbisiana]
MSSCLGGGGGRAYGFDLDIVKPSSPSSGRSSDSSSPSSTLSESSNTISIKRARTPRKRPNQTYNEAAALLSTIYPNIFSTKSLKKLSKNPRTFASFPESSDLLPPFPVLGDAGFLIDKIQPEKPAAVRVELKLKAPFEKECTSPVSNVSWERNSPNPFDDDDDFDAESILDQEVEAGIDSIMGNLNTNTPTDDDNSEGSNHSNSCINPLLRSLIGCKMGGKFELGLGFRLRRNWQRALRNRDEGYWWRSPTVPVRDITPDINPSTATATVTPPALEKEKKKKKKKKKVDKEEVDGMKNSTSATPTPPQEKLKASLGLKLSHEEVINAWSDSGSIFSDGPDSPNSSADALARLADMDLFLDAAGVGGVREASVLRYKEKRRNRLFSKMIRYQGRFVRRPSLLQGRAAVKP